MTSDEYKAEMDEVTRNVEIRAEQISSDLERRDRGCPTFNCERCKTPTAFWRNACLFCGHPARGFRRKRPKETVTPVNAGFDEAAARRVGREYGYTDSEFEELMGQGI